MSCSASLCLIFPPSLLKSRLPAIKVKYLLLAWLGILIASWVIYMQYASYSELCRGHVCHMVIVSSVSKYCESHPHSVDQDATERLEVKPSVFFFFFQNIQLLTAAQALTFNKGHTGGERDNRSK